MRRLTEDAYQPIRPPLARSDEVLHPQPERRAAAQASPPAELARHPRNVRILPRSRDFH